VRLVIVGAGSQSTPHLVVTPELRNAGSLDVTLVGRDENKTRAIGRAIRFLNGTCRVRTANLQDDLTEPFAAADAILVQPRYVGYSARLHDETFPHRYGVPGDEGLGLGGIANAWRSWPELAKLLERIRAASPRANVVFLTAPLGILTRCASAAYPSLRWYALCELPFATLKDACKAVEVEWQTASFDYAGVNHLGWFDRLECGGRDLLPVLAALRAGSPFPSGALISQLEALPLKYLELHYHANQVVARQRAAVPRSEVLRQSAARVTATYESGDPEEVAKALSARSAPWYYDAVAPLLAFLSGAQTNVPFFLTVRNNGYLPELDDDDAVEVPHVAGGAMLKALRRKQPLRRGLSETLEAFVHFERLAAEALLNRDEAGIARAIGAHPWVGTGTDDIVRDVVTFPSTA
jgi:6-phospho-beta-glucosidase